MTIEQQRLKVSLTIAIQKWLERCNYSDYDSLDIIVHETICEDMAAAAFEVLITVKKTMDYLRKDDLLKS